MIQYYDKSPEWISLSPQGKLDFVLSLQERRARNSQDYAERRSKPKSRPTGRKAAPHSTEDTMARDVLKLLSEDKIRQLLKL